MIYRKDLKIEFRAVIYGVGSNHVLEYRISPDQNLEYKKEHSYLWGLIKITKKHKFDTKWYRALHFLNYPGAYKYDENECLLPIFIYDKKQLKSYQDKFKTIGDFFDDINAKNDKEKEEWTKEKNEYKSNRTIWY